MPRMTQGKRDRLERERRLRDGTEGINPFPLMRSPAVYHRPEKGSKAPVDRDVQREMAAYAPRTIPRYARVKANNHRTTKRRMASFESENAEQTRRFRQVGKDMRDGTYGAVMSAVNGKG